MLVIHLLEPCYHPKSPLDQVAHLFLPSPYLIVVVNIRPTLFWSPNFHLTTQKASFPPVSLDTVLTPNISISSAYVRPNGAPVVVLSSGVAYTYDADLLCFTKVVEARWGAGSDAWEGRVRAGKASDDLLRRIPMIEPPSPNIDILHDA